ncbi:MAG: hypothetical protein JNM00_05665 [Flavobacteriales bacterium]|nr:hypothetical protein [Flavobacteriales bacterium]
MRYIPNFLFAAFIIVFTACKTAQSGQIVDESTNLVGSLSVLEPEGSLSSYPLPEDFQSHVLTEGLFHAEEIWEDVDRGNWYGLFRSNNQFYLKQTKVSAVRQFDPLVDEEHESTGWQLWANHYDTCEVLIEAIPVGLFDHPVTTLPLPADRIYPGDTVRFQFADRDYLLYATGNSVGDDDPVITNYRLFLSQPDGSQATLLVAHDNFDDQMVNLNFIGDIDGDLLPDFIIDTSRHYNTSMPTVYLSSTAPSGQLVIPAGGHRRVGC